MFILLAIGLVYILINMAFYKREDNWYITYTVIQLNLLLITHIWDIITLKRIRVCLFNESILLDWWILFSLVYSIIISYYLYWWFHEKICIEGYSNGLNLGNLLWYLNWPLKYSNYEWLYYQDKKTKWFFILWIVPFCYFCYYFMWYNYHEALVYLVWCNEHWLYIIFITFALIRLSIDMPIWYFLIHIFFFIYPILNRFTAHTVYRIDAKSYPDYLPDYFTPYTIDDPENSPGEAVIPKKFFLLRYPPYKSCMHFNYPCLYWDLDWLYWYFLPFTFL